MSVDVQQLARDFADLVDLVAAMSPNDLNDEGKQLLFRLSKNWGGMAVAVDAAFDARDSQSQHLRET